MKILNKLIKNPIVKNISWLVIDKFLILFLQFFVGVKIANYYGSQIYGEYNYAVAIVAFSGIFLEIINGRVVKGYYKEDFNKVVSTMTSFRNLLSIIIFLITILLYPFFKDQILLYIMLLLLTFDNCLLTATVGIENYFEYKLLSKNIVIANNIVKVISYIGQYIGIILNYSIIMIPVIRIIGSLLRMIILKSLYFKLYKVRIKFLLDKKLLQKIIKDSYYMWLSMIAFIIYTQLDKIMINKILGTSQVGVYSIAIQLSGITTILIGPFQNSVYPKLLQLYEENEEKYKKFYLKINIYITQIYILLSLLSIFIIKNTFLYVYKSEYYEAIPCYILLLGSVIIRANASLQTGHMVLKKITQKSFYKTLLGLVLNGGLNLILIPKYGIKGAALATSITHIITAFLIDYFIKEYREQFFIQLKSFNIFNILQGEKND